MDTILRTLSSRIERAWKDTGKEFSSLPHPRSILWTEAASLTYPFYGHLTTRLRNTRLPEQLAIIPEYSPVAPSRARCENTSCSCHDAGIRKKGVHIDLCLVKFGQKITYPEAGSKNMWCFKPKPIIAMEFKYSGPYDGNSFAKDIDSLSTMERVYGAQLLYLCFATHDYGDIEKALLYIKDLVVNKRSLRDKLRLAVGSEAKESDWKVLKL